MPTGTSDIAINARNLGKVYSLGRSAAAGSGWRKKLQRGQRTQFWALQDVSFEVGRGQVTGIIGDNGAGKSTLLKILSRITEPSSGSVEIFGRVGSLLEVGTGFHPELTGRENIFLNGVIIGMKRSDIRKRFDEIVEFAGVEDFLDTPVKRYSSGMYMRLAFSVAAHLDPDILIVDEVLAVGDSAFQKKCLGKLHDVATESKRTVVFVSHNLQAIQTLCDNVLHIKGGRVAAFGDTRSVVARYLESTNAAISGSRYWEGDAPGDENVRLRGVEVRSGGSESGIYSSSQDVTVELAVESNGVIPEIRIGFDLITSEGIELLSSVRPNLRPHSGLNRWRCTIPAGLLNAGSYKVVPHIRANEEWLVRDGAAVGFEMILDHGVSPYWNSLNASSRPGVIAPILDWSLSEVCLTHAY